MAQACAREKVLQSTQHRSKDRCAVSKMCCAVRRSVLTAAPPAACACADRHNRLFLLLPLPLPCRAHVLRGQGTGVLKPGAMSPQACHNNTLEHMHGVECRDIHLVTVSGPSPPCACQQVLAPVCHMHAWVLPALPACARDAVVCWYSHCGV